MSSAPVPWAGASAAFLVNMGQGVLRPAMPPHLARSFAANYMMVTMIPVGRRGVAVRSLRTMTDAGQIVGPLLLGALADIVDLAGGGWPVRAVRPPAWLCPRRLARDIPQYGAGAVELASIPAMRSTTNITTSTQSTAWSTRRCSVGISRTRSTGP
jgi:hypothetical protein